jgi:hypothetical protein
MLRHNRFIRYKSVLIIARFARLQDKLKDAVVTIMAIKHCAQRESCRL